MHNLTLSAFLLLYILPAGFVCCIVFSKITVCLSLVKIKAAGVSFVSMHFPADPKDFI